MVREALVTSVTWTLSRVLLCCKCFERLGKNYPCFMTDFCTVCFIVINSVPVSAAEVVDEPGVDGAELEIGTGSHLADVVE